MSEITEVKEFQANVLSTEEPEIVKEETVEDNSGFYIKESASAVVVDHIMFSEDDMSAIINLLDSISVKGASNVTSLSDVYRIITTRGMRVPVTIK